MKRSTLLALALLLGYGLGTASCAAYNQPMASSASPNRPTSGNATDEPAQNDVPVKEVYAGPDGHIHVVDVTGQDIEIPPEPDQVEAGSPAVASDGATIGWLAEFPNCCTSYPVPLTLVLYRHGHVIRSIHSIQMITAWTFLGTGKEVAFCRDVLHGSPLPSCERDDVKTGRSLETWTRSVKRDDTPAWVRKALQAAKDNAK